MKTKPRTSEGNRKSRWMAPTLFSTIVSALSTVGCDAPAPEGARPETVSSAGSIFSLEYPPSDATISPFDPSATKPGERRVLAIGDVEFAFLYCPPGAFTMGSPKGKGREDERPQRRVSLTKGFWLMETELTQRQWTAITGMNPSYFKGEKLPVERVSWNDLALFCDALNDKLQAAPTGWRFDLPTEAEWEYACRAGTSATYYWGDDYLENKANCDSGNRETYLGKTANVASYAPNPWGFYDMGGNVWEWVRDWREEDWREKTRTTESTESPENDQIVEIADPIGPSGGIYRVQRGGAWSNSPEYCRSASRFARGADERHIVVGARIALVSNDEGDAPSLL